MMHRAKNENASIKVLHVLSSLAVRNGMLSVVENYHKFIDPADVQFDYLYFFDLPDNRREEIEEYGSRTFFLPFQEERMPFRAIERFFAKHDGEFDILHCHPPFTPQLFARAAKRHGVKSVIAHSHSTKFSDKRLSAVRNWLLSKILGFFATDYIACSEDARVLLGRHGKEAFILHNAIDCERFVFNSENRKSARAELGICDDILLLGTVGRLSPEKNQSFLLDMLFDLKKHDVNCKLAFAGSGNCEELLRAKVRELGLESDVLLLGNRSDTPRLYSAYDVFLLSSIFEGMPISAIEAQACGLPCLLSDAITREAGVGNALFLPINQGTAPWVEAAMSAFADSKNRIQPTGMLKKSGFDAATEAVNLESFYRRLIYDNDGER